MTLTKTHLMCVFIYLLVFAKASNTITIAHPNALIKLLKLSIKGVITAFFIVL